MLSNTEVAQKLLEIRTLMEMAGESFYKYMAYEKAAASVENAPPLADLVAAGEHLKLPGVGKSIGAAIEQLVRTGSAEQLEQLYQRFPPTLLEVLGVSGIGTQDRGNALRGLRHRLAGRSRSRDRRRNALAGVPRLGSKTHRELAARHSRLSRTPAPYAAPASTGNRARSNGLRAPRTAARAAQRTPEVCAAPKSRSATSIWSARRTHAADVVAHFTAWTRARGRACRRADEGEHLASGRPARSICGCCPTTCTATYCSISPDRASTTSSCASTPYVPDLRVSENGILNLENGEVITCTEEAGVYAALGMQYVPPELRSGLDEIELARDRRDPRSHRSRDLRGDFPHAHRSGATATTALDAMIAAAAARGYEYHAISDHSHVRGRRFGIEPSALREQRAAIETLGERHGIRTLCASEVDILPDGSLDFDDAVLGEARPRHRFGAHRDDISRATR